MSPDSRAGSDLPLSRTGLCLSAANEHEFPRRAMSSPMKTAPRLQDPGRSQMILQSNALLQTNAAQPVELLIAGKSTSKTSADAKEQATSIRSRKSRLIICMVDVKVFFQKKISRAFVDHKLLCDRRVFVISDKLYSTAHVQGSDELRVLAFCYDCEAMAV